MDAFDASRKAAEAQGAAVFEELAAAHQMSIMRERKKGTHAFSSRRRAIERRECEPGDVEDTVLLEEIAGVDFPFARHLRADLCGRHGLPAPAVPLGL